MDRYSKPSQSLVGQWTAELDNMGFTEEQIRFVVPVPPDLNDTADDYSRRATALFRSLKK
jgi:hypothetical protein